MGRHFSGAKHVNSHFIAESRSSGGVMTRKPPDKQHYRGYPKKPPGTHHNSPEELAAINLPKKYGEGEKNPSREGWKFRIEVVTAIGIAI
jgi:hypothetical protein